MTHLLIRASGSSCGSRRVSMRKDDFIVEAVRVSVILEYGRSTVGYGSRSGYGSAQ